MPKPPTPRKAKTVTRYRVDTHRVMSMNGMTGSVTRIGYPDEGLRLTFSIGMPFDYSAEIQLGRADAEWLRDLLTQALADKSSENLPK